MAPSAGERPVCLMEGFLVVQTLRDPEFLHPRLQVSIPSWLAVPASLFSLAVWALTLFSLASGYIDLPVITLSLHALRSAPLPRRRSTLLKLHPFSTPRLDSLGSWSMASRKSRWREGKECMSVVTMTKRYTHSGNLHMLPHFTPIIITMF